MKKTLSLLALPLLCAGCATNKVQIAEPTTVRPQQQVAAPVANGSIYQAASYRPLFEDRRARFAGDILTIVINEKTSASNQTSNSNSRNASASMGTPSVPLLGGLLNKASVGAKADSKSEDKDAAKNDNLFTGTITVTVTNVLANGNLQVSGEKQVGVNGETDTLRFSGVVNPATIQLGNTVPSTQVADARIETVSRSNIDGARVAGFLGRFFMSFIPFR